LASPDSSGNLAVDVFLSVVLPGIGAFLAILINNRLKDESSKKSNHANDLLFLCELISTTRVLAANYWKSNFYDLNQQTALEAQITGALHGCTAIIFALEDIPDYKRLYMQSFLGEFRRSCTSGDFGTPGRRQDILILRDIEATGRKLEASVMSCRWS